ncbi:MAG: hypothetical protein HC801_11325 [Nitrospira sp.]|nr:hypothetical protein [Nitrospira sp.]
MTEAKSAWSGYHIEGLRDPLAKDPTAMVIETGLEPTTVKAVWSPYYALDSPLVLARAQSVLQPPTTVKLHIEGETLVATGSASTEWARETRRLAMLVPGISQYRDEGLVTTSIPVLLDQINRTVIRFRSGSSTVGPVRAYRSGCCFGYATRIRSGGVAIGPTRGSRDLRVNRRDRFSGT